MFDIKKCAAAATRASYETASLSTVEKNKVLAAIADAFEENSCLIISANAEDTAKAEIGGMAENMIDRLRLTDARIKSMADGVRVVASLPDPIGEVLYAKRLPNGLEVGKQRVPLGTIGIIYEARPNVTADAAALCLKSGNATLLRGGKEAYNSNLAIIKIMKKVLEENGINPDAVSFVEDTSRETAAEMMKLNGVLDVLIPRGGKNLIKSVVENSTVPVIETGTGNCHIYVDKSADFDMAVDILINAKTSRPSVCNAAESLLVHEAIAAEFLPKAAKALAEHGVKIIGCEKTRRITEAEAATDEDYGKEYLDLIISCKVVSSTDEAISHINRFGTGHSEAIITNSYEDSQKFLNGVDAAAVYVNASTRFTDGFEFGFGAEIGISTQKLHARGPMGLSELTTTKYIIRGNGQIRG